MNLITTPDTLGDVRRYDGEVLKSGSRYAQHFRVVGLQSRHFRLFDCAPSVTGAAAAVGPGECC